VEGSPGEAGTLVDALEWRVAHHPERVHITFLPSDEETQTFRYRELLGRARRAAASLQRAGLERQQAVAVMLPTSLEFFVAFTAS